MKSFSKLILITLCTLAIAGCDNNKATAKSYSKFSYISDKCQVIGAIDIKEIAKMENVQKMLQEDQTIPYYKEIKASGLGLDNLNCLYFGAEIPASVDQASIQSEGVFLLEAKSEINLPEFISLAEKNNNIKFKTETIGAKQAYILSNDSTADTPPTYIIQLNDKLIAIGTKAEITNTVTLFEKGGKSVLDNAGLMKTADNGQSKDMVWFAASVPPEVNKENDPNSPDINDLFISANYINEILTINGKIVCATDQDAQKILMPAQILTSMAVMTSNNTIKPEDLSIKADKNNLDISIKLSKEALKNMMEKSASQIQQQPVVTEEVITEEILAPDTSLATNAPVVKPVVKPVAPVTAPKAPVKTN